MEKQIIGIKQLHQKLKDIAKLTGLGYSFLVIKNSKPVFTIEPIEKNTQPKYTLADFSALKFKARDKNLSRKVDKFLYGI